LSEADHDYTYILPVASRILPAFKHRLLAGWRKLTAPCNVLYPGPPWPLPRWPMLKLAGVFQIVCPALGAFAQLINKTESFSNPSKNLTVLESFRGFLPWLALNLFVAARTSFWKPFLAEK
jgi:hypothetical protein